MYTFLIAVLLTLSTPIFSLEEKSKEIITLDSYIECAKTTLNKLISLKEKILEYQATQVRYMQDPENSEILYTMIKLAHQILDTIKTSELTLAFDPAFLSELTIIAKPAAKMGIPKP